MHLPRFVSDGEASDILTWDLCLDAARTTFEEQAAGRVALTEPRIRRLTLENRAGYRVKGAAFFRFSVAGLRASRMVILNSWPEMETIGVVQEDTAYTRRVGAVTAVALESLGRTSFSKVCLFGAGRLAHPTLDALMHRYDLGEVAVLSRCRSSREEFARRFAAKGLKINPSDDPENSVSRADLVITMTSADDVLVRNEWVCDRSVVVSMGGGQELDFDLLDRAGGVFVDDLEGCLESGDLARAEQAGRYDPDWITGTLAELLYGPREYSWSGPTVFIPRGMAAMDVMQAHEIMNRL